MAAGEILDALLPTAHDTLPEGGQLLLVLIAAVKLVTLVENLREATVARHLRRRLAGITGRRMTGPLARMGTSGWAWNGTTRRTRLTLGVFFH